MPKEKISDQYGSSVAQVTWSQDRHVQLATLSTNPKEFAAWCRDIADRFEADEVMEKSKRVPHITDPGRLFEVDSMGMFWTPDRHEVNQLIRVLRRARNAAFGADE